MSAEPITFGDYDPEDAFDADDTIVEKVDVLVRWAVSVLVERAYDGDTPRVLHRRASAHDHAHALAQLAELTPFQVAALALVIEVMKP